MNGEHSGVDDVTFGLDLILDGLENTRKHASSVLTEVPRK